MQEIYEFRIPEAWACEWLERGDGTMTRDEFVGMAQNWTVDARAGLLLHATVATPESAGSEYHYDLSGRLTQDFEGGEERVNAAHPAALTHNWCPPPGFNTYICYSNGTRAKTYDAENRLRTESFNYQSGSTSASYGFARYGGYWDDSSGYRQPAQIQAVDYGTTSHPMRLSLNHPYLAVNWTLPASETRAWLWDGNDRFLECSLNNSQCQTPILAVEGLADYDLAHATLIRVNDRNRYGVVAMSRNARAFSPFADLPGRKTSRMYAPRSVDDVYQAPYGAGYEQAPCDKQHDGKLTADGWTFDYETWQGVRTSDQSVGQWNTPDTYAGEVRDPMSQKPYMWNRNNPYEYSDPSGFDPNDLHLGFNGSSFVTPGSVIDLNHPPKNAEGAKNGAAHGKIIGGTLGSLAGAIPTEGITGLIGLGAAIFATGAGLAGQNAGEKTGEAIGDKVGGYLGDPGPVDASVQKTYDTFNLISAAKGVKDLSKAAASVGTQMLKSSASAIKRAAKKAVESQH